MFTSLVGVFCAIFVWNYRSPALTCSDLFISNFTYGSLRISLRTQTYFRLSLGWAENNLFRRNQVTAGNTSAFAGYLRMSSCMNRVANHHSSGNWLFQSSVSWCWPKDTWALGTRFNLGQNLLRHIARIPIFCTHPDRKAYCRRLKNCFPLPLLQCCLR